MKKGTEISPEENYRLRNEDIYGDESNPQAFGKVNQGKDSIGSSSTMPSQFPDDEYSETTGFRESSQTLYAKAGDKKVGL